MKKEEAPTPSEPTAMTDKLLNIAAQLNALELTVGALVVTHPKPVELAAALRNALERATTEHLFDPWVSDEVRARYRATVESFISLADEQTPRED